MDMGDRRQESLTAQVRSYYEAHIAEIQECLQEAVDEVFNVQPENLIIFIANALLRSQGQQSVNVKTREHTQQPGETHAQALANVDREESSGICSFIPFIVSAEYLRTFNGGKLPPRGDFR